MGTPERLLVVDDEASIREVMRYALERPQRSMAFAASLEEALQAAEQARFDVALLDKNLPDGSGLQLAGRLRQRFTDLEWVMVTGYASLDSAVEALDLGAFAYLTKPFDLKVLIDRVDAAFAKVAMRRQAGVAAASTLTTLVDRLSRELVVLQATADGMPDSPERAELGLGMARAVETARSLNGCIAGSLATKP